MTEADLALVRKFYDAANDRALALKPDAPLPTWEQFVARDDNMMVADCLLAGIRAVLP